MTDTFNLEELNNLSQEEKAYALKILNELSKDGKSKSLDNLKYSDYEEIPVDIETFLRDKKYLGNGLIDSEGRFTVFPYWVEVLKKIFPNNLDTAYNTLVLTGGIGLGKSFVAVICIAYLLYRMMCLKDPYLHYGLQPIDKITFSLINITLDAAKGVAWDKLQQLIQSSSWFMSKGTVSGRAEVVWKPPKGLELVIGSSNNAVIGRAIFANFTDEVNFSAMTTDIDKIKRKQKTLITQVDARMQSRFMKGNKLPTLQIIASSKNSDQSFLENYINMKRENESKTTLVIDEPQWIIRNDKDSPNKFWVAVGNKFLASEILPKDAPESVVNDYRDRGYQMLQVPEGYWEAFNDNVEIALTDIAGISTTNALKYISGVRLKDIKTNTYRNPFSKEVITVGTDDETTQYKDFFDITAIDPILKAKPMFIHLDMSIKGDRTGIAGVWIKGKKPSNSEDSSKELFYKVAFSVAIQAPRGYEISFEKNRNFIRWLKSQGFNIKGVSSDTFQAAQIHQQLKTDGFNTSIISVDRLDNVAGSKQKICIPYQNLRSVIYEKRIELYENCPVLTDEIIGLEKEPDGHINHPDNGASGCFTGETKVRLTDGRSLSFLELIEEQNKGIQNFVYSINKQTQKIEAKPILKAWKTLENQPLVRVTLDDGSFVECTYNHRFMLRNGEYIEAQDLLPNDSLMPLYTKNNAYMKGYRLCYNPFENKWHYEHRQFASEVLDEKYLVHHKDCNPQNNNPDNLIWCSKTAHQQIHSKLSTGAHSPEASKKRSDSLTNYYSNNKDNPVFLNRNKKISNTLKSKIPENIRLQREEEKIAQKQRGVRRKALAEYHKNEKINHIREIERVFNVKYDELTPSEKDSYGVKLNRFKHPEVVEIVTAKVSANHIAGKYKKAAEALSIHNQHTHNLKELFPEVDDELFKQLFGFSCNDPSLGRKKGVWINRYRQYLYDLKNHKVVSIEFISKRADVYDIEVKDNHNFALDCGVFVHNSKDISDAVCLGPDTLIYLLDGSHKTIKELYDRKDIDNNNWVLSYNTVTNNIEPVKIADVINNGYKEELLKLYLDNGQEIVCTPDHKILTRQGNYVEAKDSLGISLMPFNYESKVMFKNRDYPYVYVPQPDGKNRGVYLHKLVCENLFEDDKLQKELTKDKSDFIVIHHKDCNRFNNNPENLEYLTNVEHSIKHTQLNTSETKRAQLRASNKKRIDDGNHPFLLMSKEQRQQNGHNVLVALNKSEKHRRAVSENNKKLAERGLLSLQRKKDAAHTPEVNAKRLKTCISRYGDQGFKSKIIQDKCRQSCLEHNGYDNPFHSADKQFEMRINKLKKAYNKILEEFDLTENDPMSLLDFKLYCYRLNLNGVSRKPSDIQAANLNVDVNNFNEKEYKDLQNKGNCIRLFIKDAHKDCFTYGEFLSYYEKKCTQSEGVKSSNSFKSRFKNKPSYNDIVRLGFKVYNHRVLKIEKIQGDYVYDLKLDKIHNFALMSGIFVHNCGATYNASQHAEEFAYDFGESLDTIIDANVDASQLIQEQMNQGFEELLKNNFDPLRKNQRKQNTQQNSPRNPSGFKEGDQYMDFGMGKAQPIPSTYLSQGIIVW